jgi:hypothetical protein
VGRRGETEIFQQSVERLLLLRAKHRARWQRGFPVKSFVLSMHAKN